MTNEILPGVEGFQGGPWEPATAERRAESVKWVRAWHAFTRAQQAAWHALPRKEKDLTYKMTAAELIAKMTAAVQQAA